MIRPVAGEPVPIGDYGQRVFGRPLAIEEFLSTGETAKRIGEGTLRQAFRVYH